MKKFITPKSKELAEQLHKEEHLIIDGKIKEDHKLSDWYYLMASGIFNNLIEKIDNSNKELFNEIINLSKRFEELEKSMKEISKQQKYLWQTIEESKTK